ncbi:MAG: glycosyltransferase family 4 protein [Acidimicrobiales bacterium]
MLVTEHLRRLVPGGIGTYVKGLRQGLGQLAEPRIELCEWQSPLPSRLATRAWARGVAGPPPSAGSVIHAPSLAVPPCGRRPTTVMVHDLAWRRVPGAFTPRGRRWHDQALARVLASEQVILAPSAATADDLMAAGAASERIEVIPEGADHLVAPDPAATTRLLSDLGIAGDFVLSVSTLEPRKNLRRLIEAYFTAPLPGRGGSGFAALLVVGPRGWGEPLPENAATRGHPYPGGVTFAGRVEDAVLSGLYARALALAYVPLWEGYGLPVIEAMAAGLPVVASPVPSAGGATLEVDPTDVVSIASGLARAVAPGPERDHLVAAGRTRAATLTWAAAAAGHVEVWRSLA